MTDYDLPDVAITSIAMTDVNDMDFDAEYEPMELERTAMEGDDYDEETYDKLLAAEILLPKGDGYTTGTVIG